MAGLKGQLGDFAWLSKGPEGRPINERAEPHTGTAFQITDFGTQPRCQEQKDSRRERSNNFQAFVKMALETLLGSCRRKHAGPQGRQG
ncbi:unnamed protein product [Boreogadus saida]